MIVCKFGGSSVADSNQIRKVAGILEMDPERRIVIVSAPGKRNSDDIKITDMLYTCQRLASDGSPWGCEFDQIRTRYLDIAKDLGIPTEGLARQIDLIEKNIAGGAGPDYAASRGEFLSAQVIAAGIGWEFLDTQEYILLNKDGTVNDKTYTLLSGAIDLTKRYIIPGFYGSGPDGKVKTFSRGGSDITGAIAARSVGADLYENWTDVSGIKMADPRIVDDPEVVHELTYQEIRELASIGANVFHEEAIAPVRSVRIPICVKNTNDPQGSGTMMMPERSNTDVLPIVGISGKRGYCRLHITKHFLNKEADYKLKLETILKVYGIVPEFSSDGFDSLSCYFRQELLQNEPDLVERIKRELEPDQICTEEKLAMIGLVGEGLYEARGVLGVVSSALATKGIAIRYLSYGGSMITCIIGVYDHEYLHALKVMYQAIEDAFALKK